MVREVHAAELGFHQSQTLWLSVPAQQFTLKPFEQAHTDSGGSDGARHMFAQNWSTKLEYQYYNFGDVTFVAAPSPAGYHVQERRTHDQVGLKLPLQLGWYGGPSRLLI